MKVIDLTKLNKVKQRDLVKIVSNVGNGKNANRQIECYCTGKQLKQAFKSKTRYATPVALSMATFGIPDGVVYQDKQREEKNWLISKKDCISNSYYLMK